MAVGDVLEPAPTGEEAPTSANRPVNATAASLLGFLHDRPMSGWDLVVTAQTVIGDFWSLTQSQVYRELTAMAGTGLVVAGERGRRDRKPYAITDAGRAAFSAWLDREPGGETIRFPLLLTLAFSRHLPAERLTTFLNMHRQTHARRLVGYEEQQAAAQAADGGPDHYTLATLDFGVTYERAVLDWFNRLPKVMTTPNETPHVQVRDRAKQPRLPRSRERKPAPAP